MAQHAKAAKKGMDRFRPATIPSANATVTGTSGYLRKTWINTPGIGAKVSELSHNIAMPRSHQESGRDFPTLNFSSQKLFLRP
jgi:hypothetical protein